MAAISSGRPSSWPRVTSPWFIVGLALLAMYVPSYMHAANGLWQTDEFGHAPIIAVICAWLFWRNRDDWWGGEDQPALGWASVLVALGCVFYVAGRGLSIASVEFLSQWLVVGGVILALGGRRALKAVRFAWLYMLFMVPLPASLVELLTGPLKHSISVLVVDLLYAVGYPIARTGVTISIGPYQLLVADACSGLNSMFSLAALGTLFIHVVSSRHEPWHTFVLVAAILPIAYVANLVRVTLLVLVTFHFGDEAGQGFLHGSAGVVLMLVALGLFMALDRGLSGHHGTRRKASDA